MTRRNVLPNAESPNVAKLTRIQMNLTNHNQNAKIAKSTRECELQRPISLTSSVSYLRQNLTNRMEKPASRQGFPDLMTLPILGILKFPNFMYNSIDQTKSPLSIQSCQIHLKKPFDCNYCDLTKFFMLCLHFDMSVCPFH